MTQSARSHDRLDFAAAAALGVAAFFAWAGFKFLDPTNVAWLKSADRAMHTLGWWFFRATPWGLPLGINPRNGIEISSSIALSDSLPLFAIPFKLLSPLLPAVFQYWGIWFLACMVLQAVFGWALAREMRLSRLACLLFAGFMLATPAFLMRLPIHMALGGHWVLLAALYLYVRQAPPRLFAWPLLLGLTAAIHAYLLAMVMAIWAAALLQRLWLGRTGWVRLAVETALGAVVTLAVLWTVGFLMTSSLGADGFGFYRMNLLSFIDPNRWSMLLPSLPHTDGDYEGLVFLGLGVLALLAVALVVAAPRLLPLLAALALFAAVAVFGNPALPKCAWNGLDAAWPYGLALALLLLVPAAVFAAPQLRAFVAPRWLPLLLASLALATFALSDKIVLGRCELGTIPLPNSVEQFASMFRSSGRMIWPVGYLAVLAVFVLLDRRLGARWLTGLAALALVVQVEDTSGQWQRFATSDFPVASVWPTPIKSPFWSLAAARYSRVRAIPVRGMNPDWTELSYYAATHNMASDAAYLGRLDARGSGTLIDNAAAALRAGSFDPGALYILDLSSARVARKFLGPNDLLREVDGYYVFARGGAALATAAGLAPASAIPPAPLLPLGQAVSFARPGAPAGYLTSGWWKPDIWGTAMILPDATLDLHLPDGGAHILRLLLRSAAANPASPQVPLAISVNGWPTLAIIVPANGQLPVSIPMPTAAGDAVIGFHANLPPDPTKLGPLPPEIGIVSMTLAAAT